MSNSSRGEQKAQKMSRLSEKLSKKILRDTGIRTDPDTFQITYAGCWQKAMGAFDGFITVGSCDRASDCGKPGTRLSAYDDGFCTIEIIADEEK